MPKLEVERLKSGKRNLELEMKPEKQDSLVPKATLQTKISPNIEKH